MRYILAIFAIVVLIGLGLIAFSGGDKKKTDTSQTPTAAQLSDYSDTNVKVRLVVDGQINGDDEHRQIVITVGRSQRVLQVIQGYQGHVIKTKTFANNVSAYNVFLRALERTGFDESRSADPKQSTGVCSAGYRFTYATIGAEDDQALWSTSCGGYGTFAGQPRPTRNLFYNQITNYGGLTASVELN